MAAEEKSTRVKKGCIAVRVGSERDGGGGGGGGGGGSKRFVIPISHLYHPLFKGLLDAAREAYGYPSSGPLRLPCSVDDFLHVRRLVEHDPTASSTSQLRSHGRQAHRHHHFPFSLYSR